MKNINMYFNSYLYRFKKSFSSSKRRNISLFALEGFVFALVVNLINNNNNLFAERLGATDSQIGLLQGIPQLIAMTMLIPGGLLTDKFKNKRTMVAISLGIVAVLYFLISFIPFLSQYRLVMLIGMLSVATGFITIYTVAWQSYFADVIPLHSRNSALTIRTKLFFIPAIILPLITGSLLTAATTNSGKIRLHQIFFILSVFLIFIQIFVLFKIDHTPIISLEKKYKFSLIVKEAFRDLIKSKKFLFFFFVFMFFNAACFIDFATYFIGQVKYLKLSETYISLSIIGCGLVQLLTVKFWGRMNEKKGVRYSIIFAAAGYAFCPLVMIVTPCMPASYGKLVYLIFIMVGNIGSATMTLNVYQCMLQVLPERNKSMCISLYTLCVVFLNFIMPIIGVEIYVYLGSDLLAYQQTNGIICIIRLISTFLLIFRYVYLKKSPK